MRPSSHTTTPNVTSYNGSEVNESNWEDWVDEMARSFGEYFDVEPLREDQHEYVHPLDEDILKGNKTIVLDTSGVV